MNPLKTLSLVGLSLLMLALSESAHAQLPGRTKIGSSGRAGSFSSARSGLGIRNNPIANPAPSLTPNAVLNPRGSLSSGQVLNPVPSLKYPRSGSSLNEAGIGRPNGTSVKPSNSFNQSTRTERAGVNRQTDDTSSRARVTTPAGTQLLISVVALDEKIQQIAPDSAWSKRLSLDELRAIPAFRNDPADDSRRKALEVVLMDYKTVALDDQSAIVSKLPEFKQTIEALEKYLSPLDVRQRQQEAVALEQLASELRLFKNGDSWIEYLTLSESTTIDNRTSLSEKQAEKLLKRFSKLVDDSSYREVTILPGFEPAFAALKSAANRRSGIGGFAEKGGQSGDSTAMQLAPIDLVKPTVESNDQSKRENAPDDYVIPAAKDESSITPPSASPNTRSKVSAGERVLFSVVALESRLKEVAPDKGWSTRLALDELRGVPVFSEQPTSDSKRASIEKILKNYRVVAEENQSADISKLLEFKNTISALEAYLTPISVRERKLTEAAFQRFARDLSSFRNGDAWVGYLIPAKVDGQFSLSTAQRQKLLKRFDKLVDNPAYSKVTALPGFGAAFATLKLSSDGAKPK